MEQRPFQKRGNSINPNYRTDQNKVFMKKLIFGVLTMVLFFTGKAQTDAGDLFVGGGLNIGGTSFFNPDSSGFFKGNGFNFRFAPEVGYFVADNFALGVSLAFETTTMKTYDFMFLGLKEQKVVANGIGGGIFGQYFVELDRELFLSFRGSLGYAYFRGETTITTPGFGSSEPIVNVGGSFVNHSFLFVVAPTIEYFVNDNVALSLGFGNLYFINSWVKNLDLNNPVYQSQKDFGLNLDFSSLTFGVKFFIN